MLPLALVYTIEPNGGMNEEPPQNGATLAAYRDALGGDTGVVVDRYVGQAHSLSLAYYAHMNPDTTYLDVHIEFTPEGHIEAVEEWRKHGFDHEHVPPVDSAGNAANDKGTEGGGMG
jgi:hypothetical protein